MRPWVQIFRTCVEHRAYSVTTVLAGDKHRWLLEIAGCQPSFRFSERRYLKKIWQKVIKQATEHPPLASMCLQAYMSAHTVHIQYTISQRSYVSLIPVQSLFLSIIILWHGVSIWEVFGQRDWHLWRRDLWTSKEKIKAIYMWHRDLKSLALTHFLRLYFWMRILPPSSRSLYTVCKLLCSRDRTRIDGAFP